MKRKSVPNVWDAANTETDRPAATKSAVCTLPSLQELTAPSAEPLQRQGNGGQRLSVIKAVTATPKLKVGAYARVSTEMEAQQSSIDIQRKHFAALAAAHEDWEFAGVYYDIVSGTKKETRPELNRMLRDCASGRINLVLTKSISRFARNTTDLIEMVRTLTATGTDLIFEREQIDTRSMGSEFLLTVLASLAEDESHSISANCRWGIQKRFQDGAYRPSSAPYGYDLRDGTYVVNPAEAEIVAEVFRRTLDGEGMQSIADNLNRRAVPTKHAGVRRKGLPVSGKWTIRTIRLMLRNICYIGDILLQKVYTDSSFRKRRNSGAYPQYYIEDHHPALISDADFEAVQTILDARKTGNHGPKTLYPLSGKVFCGVCGAPFYRDKKPNGTVYWVCKTHRSRASDCPMRSIREETVWAAFDGVLRKLREDDAALHGHISALENSFRANHQETLRRLEEQLQRINRRLESITETRNRCRQRHADRITRQNELRMERLELESLLDRLTDPKIQQAHALLSLLHGLNASPPPAEPSTDGGADLVSMLNSLIERITVCENGQYAFHFLCGLTAVFPLSERREPTFEISGAHTSNS